LLPGKIDLFPRHRWITSVECFSELTLLTNYHNIFPAVLLSWLAAIHGDKPPSAPLAVLAPLTSWELSADEAEDEEMPLPLEDGSDSSDLEAPLPHVAAKAKPKKPGVAAQRRAQHAPDKMDWQAFNTKQVVAAKRMLTSEPGTLCDRFAIVLLTMQVAGWGTTEQVMVLYNVLFLRGSIPLNVEFVVQHYCLRGRWGPWAGDGSGRGNLVSGAFGRSFGEQPRAKGYML